MKMGDWADSNDIKQNMAILTYFCTIIYSEYIGE
jgi:hypothetical protein